MAENVHSMKPEEEQMLHEPNFAHLTTLMPDGSPHTTAVWVDYEDGTILVNTAVGRVKDRNVRRDHRVALSIVDQQNPYQTVTIRGRVTDITTDGAEEHIDRLAQKYLGKERYPYRSDEEQRVILRIEPERVTSNVA